MNRVKAFFSERGAEILIAAGVVVGIAISLDGAVSRGFNGLAGILWFIAAASLAIENMKRPEAREVLPATILYCLVLVLAVRPSDLLWAAVGFSVAGGLIAFRAGRTPERAALLLPALWLPVHLAVAVVRAVIRAIENEPARVRTDPPPTAAIVPLAMIVAAYAGGWAVARYRTRNGEPAAV